MKTKIIRKEDEDKNPELPCLMQSLTRNIVVLISAIDDINARAKGMVVFSIEEKLPEGTYSEGWYTGDLIPFGDKLILENTYE